MSGCLDVGDDFMKTTKKTIYVVCPGDAVTGGPEVLHQLVHELKRIGLDAFISYFPFDAPQETPVEYQKYNVPVGQITDSQQSVVVIPEVLTGLIRQFKSAEVAVWWLSVDNYFGSYSVSALVRAARSFQLLLLGRRVPLFFLGRARHFTQSYYAQKFLRDHKLKGEMLSDYLSEEHYISDACAGTRGDVIVYNPKKGSEVTSLLINACPEHRFVALQGFSISEVRLLLGSAKVYIDFGHHPGKDRIPREAALAGCCVITGLSGSAHYDQDVSIPSDYKFDHQCPDLIAQVRQLVGDIFVNFRAHQTRFDEYRNTILGERLRFSAEVRDAFL
jgi:hypothetical protein